MSEALDKTLVALSHPTRRAMLERLRTGRLRVTALAEPYGTSLNAVSKHIKVLESAGLIERERVGREHFITLNPEPMREVSELVQTYSRFWMSRLDALDTLLGETPATLPAKKAPQDDRETTA